MDTFGEWLRAQRSRRRLTREEFAKRIGCSVSALRKIENGERRPSVQIAELLANCLDIPAEGRSTFVRVARGELSVERLRPEAAEPSSPSYSSSKSNLPVFPTPLIGRERQVEQLCELLRDPQCHLLTLVGPGGIGKTRLAVEAGERAQHLFANGTFFVPFAPVTSTRLAVPVIANSIGFAFHHASHADPKMQLFGYLKEKQLLLIIDNLEQLLTGPGIELLGEMLECAPQIKLLATSRQSLDLQHEWTFEVQGLALPENADRVGAAHDTSVELFLQRARRVSVGYEFTSRDYPSILHICELMEGNPLGIELAASWVRTLSCEEIECEIEHGLDFLRASAHDMPARHQSMRAVFEHSWELLSEEERQVLMRLSLFQGGAVREAAEQVAHANLMVLSALVTKSLLRRSGAGRYGLHELVRQFAAEQFAEHAEERAAAIAEHARYYLTLFSQTDRRLRSASQTEALAELTAEMINFRAAWDWAVLHGEFALIERTLRTFWMLYDTRGWYQQGFDTLRGAIEAIESSQAAVAQNRGKAVALAHLLSTAGWLAYRMANYEQAQSMLERSSEIVRPLDEGGVLVEAVSRLGMLMEMTGNYDRASRLYSEGLAIASAMDDRWYMALNRTCQNGLGVIAHMAENPLEAHAELKSAVAEWRQIGDLRMTAFGLRLLSHSAFALERYDEARAVLEESVQLNQSVGDGWGLASAYRGLGIAAQALDQQDQAVGMFSKSLDTFTELGASWWVARVLADLGRSFSALENEAEARRVARESLRIAAGIRATPVILDALVSFAMLPSAAGDVQQALELVHIVLEHPASLQESRNRAKRLRSELEKYSTAAQLAAVPTRAAEDALHAAINALLQ